MDENKPVRKRLLWVDDDGPKRFQYEEFLIREEAKWELAWALDVYSACQELAQNPYDALILDQMMPYRGRSPDSREIWGGCLVFRWLRGMEPPRQAPLVAATTEVGDLSDLEPLTANRRIAVLFVSAYFDDAVYQAIREAEPDMEIHPKKFSEEILLRFLNMARL